MFYSRTSPYPSGGPAVVKMIVMVHELVGGFEVLFTPADPPASAVSSTGPGAKGTLLSLSSLGMDTPAGSATSARPMSPCPARHIISAAQSEAKHRKRSVCVMGYSIPQTPLDNHNPHMILFFLMISAGQRPVQKTATQTLPIMMLIGNLKPSFIDLVTVPGTQDYIPIVEVPGSPLHFRKPCEGRKPDVT